MTERKESYVTNSCSQSTDKETLIQLLEKGKASDNTSLLAKNYHFFEDKLERADLQAMYDGIQKLEIVDIALKRNYDNPQLIFESLNSKGVQLSPADLIRNYVLMGQEPDFQKELYKRLLGSRWNECFWERVY